MNALTHFSAKSNLHFLPSSLNYRRPVLSRPLSSLSFTTPPPPSSCVSIKASSSLSPEYSVPKAVSPNPEVSQTLTQSRFEIPVSLIKSAVVTTVAATALFLGRFCLRVNPAVAAAVPFPATEETHTKMAGSDAETENALEERWLSNANDVEAAKNLLEIKLQNRKIGEALGIIDRLMELEPSETEWPLLKNHMYVLTGKFEMARRGFDEILAKDPFRVEAYHGLIAASEDDKIGNLRRVEKRIVGAMGLCKNDDDRKNELVDFKLLLAQIRAIEGQYEEALKAYQELEKEEPQDYRPYLSQAIVYTLLGKENEAQRYFQMYQKLLPRGSPFASYFDESMLAAKLYSATK